MATMTHHLETATVDAGLALVGVYGGVDTHKDTHTAVALSATGAKLGVRQFPADGAGYVALLAWLRGFGPIVKVGVEGTGSYGAGLTRVLLADDVTVIEVDRPNRAVRRRKGKSDPIDADNAARAVLAGTATGTPKIRDGKVEAIRNLRLISRPAAKHRDQTLNRLKAVIVTAPDGLRASLRTLTATQLIRTTAAYRPDPAAVAAGDHTAVVKHTLKTLARRWLDLDAEVTATNKLIRPLIRAVNPRLLDVVGVGPEVAGQLLITVGDNPDRLHSDAALAALAGISPVPASSGRTHRHRLNRGGDRQANWAIHQIVLTRMACHDRTRTYIHTHVGTGPGKKTKREAMRLLKRYLCRELQPILTTTCHP